MQKYTARICTGLSLILLCLATACGPKDIGTGTSSDWENQPQGISTADQLRYPIYGSNTTQQLLYFHNRPDLMQQMQKWRMESFIRMHGLKPINPENPEYRSVPRQRSPFRQ